MYGIRYGVVLSDKISNTGEYAHHEVNCFISPLSVDDYVNYLSRYINKENLIAMHGQLFQRGCAKQVNKGDSKVLLPDNFKALQLMNTLSLIGRNNELFAEDIANHEKELQEIVSSSRFLVVEVPDQLARLLPKKSLREILKNYMLLIFQKTIWWSW